MTAPVLFLALAAATHTVTLAPGETVAVHVAGPAGAPTVALVPGLIGSEYGYRQILPALHAAGLRTVVLEPLAVGDSSRPAGADYTLTAQARRLAAAADSVRVGRAVWVAHGVTASMVLRLALARPDLVRGIVSLEGGPAESAATAGAADGLGLASLVARFGGQKLLRDRLAQRLRESSGDPAWVTETVVRKYFASLAHDLEGTIAALQAMAGQPEPETLIPRLGGLDVPVVLLVGGAPGHRGHLPAAEIDLLRDALPDLTLETVPGAGHYLHEERPDVVVAAILDLVRRTAVGAAR